MAEALKHGLARPALVRLAKNLKRAEPSFQDRKFISACLRGLEPLELKERVVHIASVMARFLPANYPDALSLLLRAASNWDGGDENDALRGFAAWPLFQFIEDRGRDDLPASMNALAELTHLFTAEFAVRVFLADDRKRSFKLMMRWASDPSDQVRRLASEGCRPRLPWASKVPSLIEQPEDGLRILEKLKDDPSEYVRRSVGNHLNDVAKDHPHLVLDLCERWQKNASPERRWIIERATRTLVKDGHPRVWKLLGFSPKPKIRCDAFKLAPRKLELGGELSLNFAIESLAPVPQKLAIDYAIHFMKADGKTRAKVFKLKVLTLAPRERVQLSKRQPLKKISTRKYYSGAHEVELVINGQSTARAGFHLQVS